LVGSVESSGFGRIPQEIDWTYFEALTEQLKKKPGNTTKKVSAKTGNIRDGI
jgi:hypothetical protein